MSWLRSLGRAFAKTFEVSTSAVKKVDEKYIDPVLGDEMEEKLFGKTLEKHCENVVDEFNIGREEVRNERKAKNCQRDSEEGCCGGDACTCGDCDPGWVEIH